MMCCSRENRAGPYCCPSTKNGMCCNESGQCCPWNMPLADKDGNCYPCDYEDDISMKFGDGGLYASVCETVCSGEREMDGDCCVLKED